MNLEEPTFAPPEFPITESAALLAPPPRSRGKLLLVLFLVFVCGAGVGVGGTVLAVQNHWVHLFKRPPQPEDIVKRFQAMFELDPRQTEEVERIVRMRHEAMEQAHRDMDGQMERFDAEIEAVLRPEQQVKWREWLSEMKRKWGPPPGSPPPGPPPHD